MMAWSDSSQSLLNEVERFHRGDGRPRRESSRSLLDARERIPSAEDIQGRHRAGFTCNAQYFRDYRLYVDV